MQLNWVKAKVFSIVFAICSLNAVPNAIVVEISFLFTKKGKKNMYCVIEKNKSVFTYLV